MKMRVLILLSALSLLLFSSCDKTIHQYPIFTESPVKVQLSVDRTPAELHTIIDNTVKGKSTICSVDEWKEINTKTAADYTMEVLSSFIATKAIDGWTVRLVWELYQKDILVLEGQSVKDELEDMPEFELEFNLPAGDYTLLAWADYVPIGTTDYIRL